jgi:4-amino-4-deoxy-L-arabinose transferase-like glycosyltransferase
MRGYEERSPGHLIAGALIGSVGFLVKGPYVFYFALPLAAFVLFRFNRRWAAYLAAAFLVCVLIFIAWRWHVNRVNGMAPDWFFIPGYTKFVDMWGRYFGPLAWRWDIESWRRLFPRLQNDIASMTGFYLFLLSLAGSFFAARRFGRRAVYIAWAWLLGVLVYLLLFFSLNVWHNYYQMPLVPIVSVFIGLGLVTLARLLSRRIAVWGWIPSLGLFAMLAVNSISYAESSYYARDETRIEAGAIIRSNTPEESLVIAAPDVRATNFEDPRLLYRARRRGWSISKLNLNAAIVRRLAGYGATHLALVVGQAERVDDLYGMKGRSYPLRSGPWKVTLFDLSQLPGDVF